MQEAIRTMLGQLGRKMAGLRFGLGNATRAYAPLSPLAHLPRPARPEMNRALSFLPLLVPFPPRGAVLKATSQMPSLSHKPPYTAIGIAGCGALGKRFVRGLAARYGCEEEVVVYVTGSTAKRGEEIAAELNAEITAAYPNTKLRVLAAASNAVLPEICQIILPGVKPNILKSLLVEMRENLALHREVLLVSLAGTGTTDFMYALLGQKITPVARVITTTAVEYLEGTSILYMPDTIDPMHLKRLKTLFEAVGTVDEVKTEAQLDSAVAVACSTGFALTLIDTWKAALVQAGYNPKEAQSIVGGMMRGAGGIAVKSKRTLTEEINAVGKKGNSLTRAQIEVLEDKGVYSALGQAYTNVSTTCATMNEKLRADLSSPAPAPRAGEIPLALPKACTEAATREAKNTEKQVNPWSIKIGLDVLLDLSYPTRKTIPWSSQNPRAFWSMAAPEKLITPTPIEEVSTTSSPLQK